MTNQPTPPTCPDCGTQLPADSPQALCPACLLRQALASRTVVDADPKPASPPLSPEEIGDKFPQFEVTECLGRGGMGVVYKARQKSLDRWVAIKILAPERVGDEAFAERFSREAQTLARLNHPNIVTVYDYGETDGLYYIVMEFVDGINLRDLLRDGRMEPKQALGIIPPVCEALQFAHDKGIVHRDIKPENLLLDREGRIKIADFGIAAMVGATGETSGTPPYMAPEQGGADVDVDHRVDIYALGAVLYETLTGERPDGALQAPSQKVQIDIRIDDIVLRALNKEPERRYGSADQFRTMVETIAATTTSGSPVPAASPTQPTPGAATPVDPRLKRAAGILLIVVGAINVLAALLSLLIIPMAGAFFENSISNAALSTPFHSDLVAWKAGGSKTMPSAALYILVFGSTLVTLILSVLTILGGRHMLRETSKPMVIVGSIACCLTPFWWPLGLLAGAFALILTLMGQTSSRTSTSSSPAKTDGPSISGMAITAAILTFLGFGGVGLLLLAAMFVAIPAGNGSPNVGVSFGALIIVVIPLFTFLPGLILGWISATRIRESNGKLTGMGLAKFAALTPLIVISLLLLPLIIRLSLALTFTLDPNPDTPTLFITGILGGLTALSVFILNFIASARRLSGHSAPEHRPIRKATLIILPILWLAVGLLIFLQLPKETHAPIVADSPDGQYSATVLTIHQTRVFGPDTLNYRLNVQGMGGSVNQTWNFPVPVDQLAKEHTAQPNSDFYFAEHGRTEWTHNSTNLSLFVGDVKVFMVGENQQGILKQLFGEKFYESKKPSAPIRRTFPSETTPEAHPSEPLPSP